MREELRLLADEQAALRLVATLVARERPPAEVFEAVATEMGQLLGVEDVALMRYEEDQTATVVGRWGERRESLAVGTRMPLDGTNVTALVYRTSRTRPDRRLRHGHRPHRRAPARRRHCAPRSARRSS